MELLEKHLVVKRSGIPGAGKGLFTKKAITKGQRIIEYLGKRTTWKDVLDGGDFNGYTYYINRNLVINAKDDLTAIARFINDASGITRIKGITNNCEYIEEKKRVFVEATKDIPAGSELFVSYGKEYWDVIRHNNKVDAYLQRQAEKEAAAAKKAATKKKASKKKS